MKFLLTALLSWMIVFSANAQSRTIEIWIRSFIPDPTHAGSATQNILKNPNGSGSIVQVVTKDLPFLPDLLASIYETVNSVICAGEKVDTLCFTTDHRGFSSDQSTTARTDTKFTITVNADGSASAFPLVGRTTTGLTKRVNCNTGVTLFQKPGKIDMDALGTPTVAGNTIQVIGQVTATDQLVPCVPTFLTPSVDYSFDLKWNKSTSELSIDFTYGVFPAYEIYARQPGNEWTPVLQELPSQSAYWLAGDAFGIKISTVKKSVVVKIPTFSGTWQSPLPDQRFSLEFKETAVRWSERNESGGSLIKDVPLIDMGDGSFKIERANDNEALTFLGFQPAFKNEILTRGTKPSFIIFRKDGTGIKGNWYGLLATKDNSGRLKDLFQPGDKPPKIFVFTKVL